MKLQAGKTYLDRQGNKVTVEVNTNYNLYIFKGSNMLNYTESGSLVGGCKDINDLIAEYIAFEIGETLEFSDDEKFTESFICEFRGYFPEDEYSYKTEILCNYIYARRPKTKMTTAEIEKKLGKTYLEVIE